LQAAAAPLAQAIGRGRCLVQGCCHGGPDAGRFAIRVENPMSRIACVAHLRGTPVGAIQLFSASVNVAIAAVLLRLWGAAAPAGLICGLYLVLTGLARFAEEGSRGEPQTPVLAGLTIYQWLSIAAFVAGAAVAMTPSTPVHPSVDWPRTRLPMSLLAPPDTAPAAREQLSSRPAAGSRPS
jgi:prolipoprotein diacylglyceryltransferase